MNNNDLQPYLDIFDFYTVERRLENTRGVLENDAEHSWSIAMLFLMLQPKLEEEFGVLDTSKIFTLITLHDIGELHTGDIATWNKKHEDKEGELEFIESYLDTVNRSDLKPMMRHYEATKLEHLSIEEKIVKSIDRIAPMLMRIKTGQGWSGVEDYAKKAEHLRDRQMVRHAFSKTMTELFEQAFEYVLENKYVMV
jgi:5'-deoxynucleotidase YfbR-like HD superfamily hydrolase